MNVEKMVSADALVHVMIRRDNDRSQLSDNKVDKGYHLAVEHMLDEINHLATQKVVYTDNVLTAMRNIRAKQHMHEYGGFEIDRISIDEAISIIEFATGVKEPKG